MKPEQTESPKTSVPETYPTLKHQAKSLARTLALVTLVFPLMGIVGWVFDFLLLKQALSGFPAMQPNTACGIILGATALFLAAGRESKTRNKAIALLATTILLFGGLTLSQYIFKFDLGIDRLFTDVPPTPANPFPGRPSPQTSGNFVLLGATLLFYIFSRWKSGQTSAIIMALNALTALTGYIFGSSELYGFPINIAATGMAIKTALSFLLLSIALLLIKADKGPANLLISATRSGQRARRTFVILLLAPVMAGALTRLGYTFGWYDISVQASFFTILLIGLAFLLAWRAGSNAEKEELIAQKAEDKLRETVEHLKRYTKKLQQSNQDLDDFAYIVSHDLKGPLRNIHNIASFFQEDYHERLDKKGIEELEQIKTLVKHMIELTDNLSYYSKVGRTELAFAITDMNEVVKKACDAVITDTDKETTTIKVYKNLPSVYCDKARVGEIFYNLISNALKYNDSAHRFVEVGCTTDHPGFEGQNVFFVADNGIGIDEKDRNAVFKIFMRLHGQRDYGGGTGSGLAIVKKIIDRHGGKIWIEPNIDGGSIFFFTLEKESRP